MLQTHSPLPLHCCSGEGGSDATGGWECGARVASAAAKTALGYASATAERVSKAMHGQHAGHEMPQVPPGGVRGAPLSCAADSQLFALDSISTDQAWVSAALMLYLVQIQEEDGGDGCLRPIAATTAAPIRLSVLLMSASSHKFTIIVNSILV